jgi:hypothetical protein
MSKTILSTEIGVQIVKIYFIFTISKHLKINSSPLAATFKELELNGQY